jgi:hypothetical protein
MPYQLVIPSVIITLTLISKKYIVIYLILIIIIVINLIKLGWLVNSLKIYT